MKELWVFGPLNKEDPDQKAKEDQVERDVQRVAALLGDVEARNMKELAERNGGEWQPMRDEAAQAPEGAQGQQQQGAQATTAAGNVPA